MTRIVVLIGSLCLGMANSRVLHSSKSFFKNGVILVKDFGDEGFPFYHQDAVVES